MLNYQMERFLKWDMTKQHVGCSPVEQPSPRSLLSRREKERLERLLLRFSRSWFRTVRCNRSPTHPQHIPIVECSRIQWFIISLSVITVYFSHSFDGFRWLINWYDINIYIYIYQLSYFHIFPNCAKCVASPIFIPLRNYRVSPGSVAYVWYWRGIWFKEHITTSWSKPSWLMSS